MCLKPTLKLIWMQGDQAKENCEKAVLRMSLPSAGHRVNMLFVLFFFFLISSYPSQTLFLKSAILCVTSYYIIYHFGQTRETSVSLDKN